MNLKKLFLGFFFILILSLFLLPKIVLAGDTWIPPGTCLACYSVSSGCPQSLCDEGWEPCQECGVDLCNPPGVTKTVSYQECADDDGNEYSQCCGGGGCFTGETEVNTESSLPAGKAGKTPKLQIKDLEEGDLVSSFDPETGEIKENTVSGILEYTREGYYELETESGKKVKVTGEHPFLAVKAKNDGETEKLKNQETVLDKVKEILSQTLTYKLITNLQATVNEILR